MDDLAIARALHVLAVVLWIGGVAFVTTVLLPAIGRTTQPEERLEVFESFERKFAWQARVTTLLAGATGFYLTERFDAWSRFTIPQFWWMHAMVLVWLVFTLMLFVIEPWFLDRWLIARARRDPQSTFRAVQVLHWILLFVSLVTVLGAVAGSHGFVL
jgi:uncharacterized membrane protein